MHRLPTLFVPHGAPTFALDPGTAGAVMQQTAATLPKLRAIVIVSPHWDTEIASVGSATTLTTIHDFHGFPHALYELTYPATGSTEASHEVSAAIARAGLPVIEAPSQGLDHGAWIPLRLMFPQAEVPVIPVSVQSHLGVQGAYALGCALAPLVDQGFLVIGSGNLTHNLGDYRIARQNGGRVPAYVHDFPDWLAEKIMQRDISALLNYRQQAPDAVRAHPSDEHLQPLYVALGAAGNAPRVERLHTGVSDYVLAMDAYAFHPLH
ncbi:MAG: dioxygenase [Oxalobacteraceae bacterium]|nr:dioxygenase [Oxalobacteraceae bacterium]